MVLVPVATSVSLFSLPNNKPPPVAMASSPRPPHTEFSPAPAKIVSLLSLPQIRSAALPARMLSVPNPPTRVSTPLPPTVDDIGAAVTEDEVIER